MEAVVLGGPKRDAVELTPDVKGDLYLDGVVLMLKRSDEEVWNAELVEELDNVPNEEVVGGANSHDCVDGAELEPPVGLLPHSG